jgi:predicted dehydrogenase
MDELDTGGPGRPEPLRIGILGAARIAATAIVAPARLSGARLVAVAARDRARAEAFAAANGVERVLDGYADVLTDPEVEAVYNPLANGLHGPWNLAAVAAGKHVLSEKPFASNAEEAEQVRDAAERAGVVAADGLHWLYHPLAERVLELLTSGELGRLARVEAIMHIPAPPPEDPRWSLALAGGALMDVGCYALHAHRVLAPWGGGEPELAAARGRERPGVAGVDEWAEADLVYPSGASGVARCRMAGEGEQMSLLVTGTRGEVIAPNFALPQADDRLVVRTDAGERVERLGTRPSYAYQLDAFTAAVRTGAPMPTDADDAVATMRLIDRCYTAIGMGPRPRWVPAG